MKTKKDNKMDNKYSEEDNRILVERFQNGDEEAFNIFLENNYGMIIYFAKKYAMGLIDNDEMIQTATIGLFKAIKTFNSKKGIKLTSYISVVIKNEIYFYLRDKLPLVKMTIKDRKMLYKMNVFTLKFRSTYSKEPDISDYANEFKISKKEVERIFEQGFQTNVCYMQEAVYTNHKDSSEACLQDLLEDENSDIYEITERNLMIQYVRESFKKLNQHDCKLLTYRYIYNMKQKEMARIYNVSQSYISRKISIAEQNLKNILLKERWYFI